MVSQTTVTLAAGNLRVELSASIGGAISALEWIGPDIARPILRKCHSPLEKVLDAASFPLVPFVNRIRGGQFAFRGREVRLAPNMPGDPSPLHGQGWLNPWVVEQQGETRAVLGFRHAAGEWPWDYEAHQEFALDGRGMSLRLTCRNTGPEPMPCGLGGWTRMSPMYGRSTSMCYRSRKSRRRAGSTSMIGWCAVRASTTVLALGTERRP
jgi:aldose 1-epimerase